MIIENPYNKFDGKNVDKFGWKKMISSHDCYILELDGFPGWDKKKNYLEQIQVPSVYISEIADKDFSINVANSFDDISDGNFWYRDHTESGMPWLYDDETYSSNFRFQFETDMEKFLILLEKQ